MKTIWLGIFTAVLFASCTTQGDIAKHRSIATSSPGSSQNAELSAFLPPGATVRLSARGDVDDDGDSDVLIVLQNVVGNEPEFKPRKMIVLSRNSAGYLEKTAENASAILCQRCGAFMSDDSLEGVRVEKNGFSLRFEGLSRVMWSKEYRFKYSSLAKTWYLYEINGGVTDRADGRSCVTQLGSKEFGSVPFAQFDPEQLPICSLP